VDRQKHARRVLKGLKDAADAEYADTLEYRNTLGDVMLSLEIALRPNSLLYIGLEHRKKAIYHFGGQKIDITADSGIIIPQTQEIGLVNTRSLEGCVEDAETVGFRGTGVERDDLLNALYTLFSTIRGYERRKIEHELGVTATGKGRNAHVSVTGFGMLREFAIDQLAQMPDTYQTKYANPGTIYLPATSKVAFIPIAPVKQNSTNQN